MDVSSVVNAKSVLVIYGTTIFNHVADIRDS